MAAPQDPVEINVKGQSLHRNGASTRLQHLKPGGNVWNSRHQLRRESNPHCNSSLCATTERSSANENAQRQSGSSVDPKRKTPGVTAQTLPLRHQDYRKQTSSSLQLSILKEICQQRKNALESLSSEQTGNQNHVHSRTINYWQQSTLPSPVQEIQPPTDVEIDAFIAKQVEQYRTTQSTEKLPTQKCVAPVDDSKDGKVDGEFTEGSGRLKAQSEEHSTDHLQLQSTVAAAACKKNEDKSPVLLISRSGMTLDKRTEKEPCHIPQECTSLNINRAVEELHEVTGVCCSPKHPEVPSNRRKTSEDQVTSSVDQIQIHNVMSMSTSEQQWKQTSRPHVMEDAVSAVPQEQPLPPANKNLENTVMDLRDPKYEDISDYEEESEVETTRPNKKDETGSPMPSLKNPQYEDISEDENSEKERLAQELSFSEKNKKQEEGHGHTQGPAQLQTASTADEKLVLLDTAQRDDGLCPKCDCERQQGLQTNHSPSCPLSCDDLNDGDESDDDFVVLPISITSILYGPEYENQHFPENISQDDSKSGQEHGHSDTAPTPIAASPYNIEVFDTVQSFLQAKGNGSAMTPGSAIEHEMMLDKDAYLPSSSVFRSEPTDSSETDDSCDYSASLPPEAGACASEKETVNSKATNEQNVHCRHLNTVSCQDSPDKSIEAKARPMHEEPKTVRQVSENQDVIIVDSDSEDESDQNCSMKAKRKRLSSGSMEFGDQQTGHPPVTGDSLYGTLKETAYLSVLQCSEPMHSKAAKAEHKHVQQETKGRHVESVIILDSDSGDDSEPNPRQENSGRLVSSGFKNSDIMPRNNQKRNSPKSVDREYGRTKEMPQEKRLPSTERPALSCCAENRVCVQHNSNKQTTTRRQVFHHSDNQISRTRTERNLPAAPKQTRQSQGHVNLCGTGNTRSRQTILLTEEPQRKSLQSRNKKAEAASGTCPVVPPVVHKDRNFSGVNREGGDETLAGTSTNTFSHEENNNILKPRRISRVPSVPNPEPHTKMLVDRRSLRHSMPGPSYSDRVPKRRQRPSSHDSVTPLMKRTMSEAKHLTNARNRDIQREQRCNVGVGYKWSEREKNAARLTKKGSSSEG